MREDQVKKILIEYLEKNKIEFLSEVNLGGCRIDFLIKSNNNWIGVEAKGERADEVSTLGQLLNYYRHMSHIILCAPGKFVKKIRDLIISNPEISHINKKLGSVSVDEGEVVITEPQNSEYYLSVKKSQIEEGKYYSKFPKYDRPDGADLSIIELIRKRGVISLGEIVTSVKLSYENARKKIKNLEHFGYIKIISKYPTSVVIGDRIEERKTNNKV